MQTCYRRRQFYGIGKHADKEERLIVEWSTGNRTLNGERFDGKFRDGDVLLKIRYEEAEIYKLGNPQALCTPALIDAAIAEHLERFPSAIFATEIQGDNITLISDRPADETENGDSQTTSVSEPALLVTAEPAPETPESKLVADEVGAQVRRTTQT